MTRTETLFPVLVTCFNISSNSAVKIISIISASFVNAASCSAEYLSLEASAFTPLPRSTIAFYAHVPMTRRYVEHILPSFDNRVQYAHMPMTSRYVEGGMAVTPIAKTYVRTGLQESSYGGDMPPARLPDESVLVLSCPACFCLLRPSTGRGRPRGTLCQQ